MRFDFDFPVFVGTTQVDVLEDGFAMIGPTPMDRSEWEIQSISVSGYRGTAVVPATHYLHTPISLYLLNVRRQDIDAAWNTYLAQQAADRQPA